MVGRFPKKIVPTEVRKIEKKRLEGGLSKKRGRVDTGLPPRRKHLYNDSKIFIISAYSFLRELTEFLR